jgi:hypothetical protein
MKAYFLNITKEERDNILDRHKTLYDGYSVRAEVPNEQPLMVQDFANDKNGITVNSSGEVSTYNNKIYMKESKEICKECGLYEDVCECGYKEVKGIGGSSDFDYVEEDECSECGYSEGEDDNDAVFVPKEKMSNSEVRSAFLSDKDGNEKVKEKVRESLEMFQRFKKYN